jgi:hypothetical protein
MSDTLGNLTLPMAVPTLAPLNERTRAPGDSALVQVGSFLATVLQSDCGAAWVALDGIKQDLPGTIDGTRTGANVVRSVWYTDPRLGYFEPDMLPGLFVFRGQKGAYLRFTADQYRRTWPISITWLPPPTEADAQRRERDTFANAIAASMQRALVFGRHRAWVRDEDLADDNGLLADAIATPTVDTTITNFDGALAGTTLKPGRPVQIITSAATGAYNTTDPILVTGTVDGVTMVERMYLTTPNGGETVVGLWSFSHVASVFVPEQLLSTGSLTLGFYRSSDARLGSLVQRAAGFIRLEVKGVSTAAIPVKRANADPVSCVAVEITCDATEGIGIDLAEHADLYDPNIASGLDASFVQGNNDPFNSFSL